MRKILLGMVATAAATTALSVPASAQGYYQPYGGYGGYGSNYGGHAADRNGDGYVTQREVNRYQRQMERAQRRADRQASRYGNYYGNSYGNSYGGGYSQYYDTQGYYSGPTWRGDDGRYYCRRSNGTTGLIVGGGAGALIGSQIAGRGDRTVGAIVGGAIGAVVGRAVERGNDRYRCN